MPPAIHLLYMGILNLCVHILCTYAIWQTTCDIQWANHSGYFFLEYFSISHKYAFQVCPLVVLNIHKSQFLTLPRWPRKMLGMDEYYHMRESPFFPWFRERVSFVLQVYIGIAKLCLLLLLFLCTLQCLLIYLILFRQILLPMIY